MALSIAHDRKGDVVVVLVVVVLVLFQLFHQWEIFWSMLICLNCSSYLFHYFIHAHDISIPRYCIEATSRIGISIYIKCGHDICRQIIRSNKVNSDKLFI